MRRRSVLGVAVSAVVAGAIVSWFVPWGSHHAWEALRRDATRAALSALGPVDALPRSPHGDLGGREQVAFGVRLHGGGTLVVTGARYRSTTARAVRARLIDPRRNAVRWDDPGRSVPERSRAWGLPPRASLVGFLCDPSGCQRWLLWWPRGADLVVLDLRMSRGLPAAAAADRLRPAWQALR